MKAARRSLRAVVGVLLVALAVGAHDVAAQNTPGRDPPSRERIAAVIPLLELQDLIYAARVTRGGMTAAEADAALKGQAAAWLKQPPTTTAAELLKSLRDEAELLLDYASLRVGAATRWPPGQSASTYKAMAEDRLDRLSQKLREAAATQTALLDILTGAAEVIGWTEGRAALEPANDPFTASHDRAVLAAVPSAGRGPGMQPPPPRPQAPPAAVAPGKLASTPAPVAKPVSPPPPPPPPVAKPVVSNPPPVIAKPPPPAPPSGTLKLVYFGLYDDRIGPRGANPNGKPDGRFVLSVDVGKLSSREVTHIALQAMDTNSRPVGSIWHTKDQTQSLLLVVAGDQWLNTQHVNGLATLEGSEVDLILFADNAPEPGAINAFIVEVGFADGSIARQLAKAR